MKLIMSVDFISDRTALNIIHSYSSMLWYPKITLANVMVIIG